MVIILLTIQIYCALCYFDRYYNDEEKKKKIRKFKNNSNLLNLKSK